MLDRLPADNGQTQHDLDPVSIRAVAERRIGKFERGRFRALADLRKGLEGETDG